MTDPKKRVLIVDDDPSVRSLVASMLSTDYVVQEAGDGEKALELLAGDGRFDVVVCDVMMPGLDGLHLAQRMRALVGCKNLPLIFLTARASYLDVVHGINAGARFYITKPFKMSELRDKVARATH